MKYPCLELLDGTCIVESTAIAAHLAREAPMSGLFGNSPFEAALCEQWIAFQQQTLVPALFSVVYPVLGHREVEKKVFDQCLQNLKSKCRILDAALAGKTYLVGQSLTVADIVVAGVMVPAMQTVLDAGFRKSVKNLDAWFARCFAQPNFIKRFGYIKPIEKALKHFDPKAVVEKAAPAKKEEAPAKKDDDDDMDLFGDADSEEEERARQAAIDAKATKKKKKEVIAMSLVMLEVKPLDDTTNLDDVAKRIFSTITQDGLFWKTEYKKEPVAFGIFKLIVGFSCEDEKTSVDGIVEKIEEFDDMVQSVEIAAFNKI